MKFTRGKFITIETIAGKKISGKVLAVNQGIWMDSKGRKAEPTLNLIVEGGNINIPTRNVHKVFKNILRKKTKASSIEWSI